MTDAKGQAIAALILGSQEGEGNNAVVARLDAADPPPADAPAVAFIASSMAIGSGPTTIRGVVLDNTDQPVPGVTLKIAGSTIGTTADSQGIFVLENAPAGTIRLEVDGTTATRPGLWPHLEFIFQAIPGRDNELPRPIYLLPLDTEGLFVSETEGGTLTVPELDGFELEIAPGSATFPGGSRTGVVSVTVVHSDKVPMIPSFHQQPRLVITVQPSGTRFDPPARLTLPNVDGHAPGEVVDFFSFDHDLARFVSIGPAQVTEDGTAVRSKPGFGIVEGGWHCGSNPSGTGTPNKCLECEICDKSTNLCVPKRDCVRCGPEGEGQICDGQGNCVVGVALLPKICDKVGVNTSGPIPIPRSETLPQFQKDCEGDPCFAAIKITVDKVTTTCSDADFRGALASENSPLRPAGGTCPPAYQAALVPRTGAGGRVIKGNRLRSFRNPAKPVADTLALCGPPFLTLPGPCTIKFERDIRIGPCAVRTDTITYTIGPSCADYDIN